MALTTRSRPVPLDLPLWDLLVLGTTFFSARPSRHSSRATQHSRIAAGRRARCGFLEHCGLHCSGSGSSASAIFMSLSRTLSNFFRTASSSRNSRVAFSKATWHQCFIRRLNLLYVGLRLRPVPRFPVIVSTRKDAPKRDSRVLVCGARCTPGAPVRPCGPAM